MDASKQVPSVLQGWNIAYQRPGIHRTLDVPTLHLLDHSSRPGCSIVSGSQRWLSEFSRRLSILDKTTITFLAISGSRNTVVREEARIGLSLFSTQVKHLEVGAVSFEAFADFASLLCEFTALESLSCASTYQIAVLPEKLQFSAPLQGLNLAFPSTTLVFEFLFLQDVLPTITSLSLSHLAVADYSILTRYLDTPNSNLQSFNIKMDSNFSGVTLGTFTEKLKMTQLKALRHLIVETTPRLSPEQAFALLATISSLQLETLEISVQLMQGVARMDILLSGNRFDFLKRLLVIGSSWAEVRQFFPRCDAKNVLQEGGNTLI
ncbi:hypothetical protein BDZ97DRAFT_1297803 [Flammula alnicola]|nr:hypothetical protein BDZ97DRAFT_1297803 [Flammula alnicola]